MSIPGMPDGPSTLYHKLWAGHLVSPPEGDGPGVLYIDLHLIHEVTSPQAFSVLRQRGLPVRRPDRTLATMDHSTPTLRDSSGGLPILDDKCATQLAQLRENCHRFGVELHDMDSTERGIVHVMGPELGATQPGMTIVCGDSHTSTHGAFGALAFGIGTSEVSHVLATQTMLMKPMKTMAIECAGPLAAGVSAKDLILAIIARIGVSGGTGHAIEYRGEAVRGLSMEGRMTICNMSIEAGARCGMVAPDETTFDYVRGRAKAPSGAEWDRAIERWSLLGSDEGARFDTVVELDATAVEPMVTYGTTPAQALGVGGRVPTSGVDDKSARALEYMGIGAGDAIAGRPVDVAFLGSCTNARISDLRAAASILRGRRVSPRTRMLVVPGSQRVRAQAEAEGLDQVFIDAGAEWREPGCSMCIAMNGDAVGRGEFAISTSNRNYEGRQGQGARTYLASPMTVAASAIAGCIADPREYATDEHLVGAGR